MNSDRLNGIITIEDEKRWDGQGYANGWEHYADELRLFDYRLQRLYFSRKKRMDVWRDDPYQGLFVSEEEFLDLIIGHADDWADDPEAAAVLEQLENLERAIAHRLAVSVQAGVHMPLLAAVNTFGLRGRERDFVVAALAVEMDRKYERVFGFLQDDLTSKHPNASLLIQLNCRNAADMMEAREALASSGPLAKYFLHRDETSAAKSLLSQPIVLDRRMVRYLLDGSGSDPSEVVKRMTQRFNSDSPPEPLRVDQALQQQMQAFVRGMYDPERSMRKRLAFHIWGPSGAGKTLHAKHCCHAFGKSALIADMAAMSLAERPFAEVLDEVLREAILQQAVLCFTHVEALFPEEPDAAAQHKLRSFVHSLNGYGGLLFLLANKQLKLSADIKERWVIDMELKVPASEDREALWKSLAAEFGVSMSVDWRIIGDKFRFTAGQIRRAFSLAQGFTEWTGAGMPAVRSIAAYGAIDEQALYEACFMQVQHRLEKKASRIHSKYSWEDVILPGEQKEQLRNACNQMKYRSIVYGQWGFERKLAYGKGLSMLFAGPPGTGKTMTAQVVAKELQLELYKIDLSQVISKYIGETEKNLHEIFHEARLSNAILFFDETDALFGKRSEVKDSHDKYANIETAYLLQKMEEYDGISVLATNLLGNIDDAFIRRINYIIKFPFPDADYREKIWRSMFPAEAPIGEDVDFKLIASKFPIAGGGIKNIAVSAAFLAADAGTPILMKHLLQAVKHELLKTGKLLTKDELDFF
ncbi:AAA family ATPase [Paenibacillus sp. LMG 31456]|uniref:AAA family ATPase n=1 Tax=Paenibacillus foliorum TaxID=2654974 RepID=A0A972GTP8_9BACL|nr:AAA family ATPase [Paenibacillus foliorum]NOU93662.1 AAA family ATPase [Paenibacillus foliorum]